MLRGGTFYRGTEEADLRNMFRGGGDFLERNRSSRFTEYVQGGGTSHERDTGYFKWKFTKVSDDPNYIENTFYVIIYSFALSSYRIIIPMDL